MLVRLGSSTPAIAMVKARCRRTQTPDRDSVGDLPLRYAASQAPFTTYLPNRHVPMQVLCRSFGVFRSRASGPDCFLDGSAHSPTTRTCMSAANCCRTNPPIEREIPKYEKYIWKHLWQIHELDWPCIQFSWVADIRCRRTYLLSFIQ